MKNFLKRLGLFKEAGKRKQRAKPYFKFVSKETNNKKAGMGISIRSLVKEDVSPLKGSELAFIKQEIKKGNKELTRLLGIKSKDFDNHIKIRVSLDTAKALVSRCASYTDVTSLVTLILNHADFPVNEFIMHENLAPEIFRDLAILFRTVNKSTSFWLIARAKMLRPDGPVISELFESTTEEYIATLNVGIGVITYNRKDHLAKTVEAIKAFTTGDYQLVVADDGSKDDTVEWCKQNNVPHTYCANKGVVRNKNRALYYLNEVKKVDVLILLEDDCRPNKENWQKEWVIAALLWGHINYAHKRIIKKEDAVVSGTGSSTLPYLCRLVTGQCTACSKDAMDNIGYLDPRFSGYGAGHVEWTERFIRQGYNGSTEKHWVYPAINTGLNSDDAPTFKNPEQLEKNRALKKKISKDAHKREPWVNTDEENEFLEEIESIKDQ
ncbi:glycosyltransferase family 2 protein [Alteromonas mediterranea]|uniref:glycosyltransferase family 2 protein n=1 Tax=Alteromonas mediterranea TaxID=314275 RepID=UPI001131E861|nr:glycosyltransferase family A protein [Alteromonas mediterranea]QDG36261.1 glycosyltransferase family 2 protein [Alteromonas mediterranea]